MTKITQDLTEIPMEEWETDCYDFAKHSKLVDCELVSPIFMDNEAGIVIRFRNLTNKIDFVFDNPDSVTVGLWIDNPNNLNFNTEKYKYRGYVFKDCRILHTGQDETVILEILPYVDSSSPQRIYIKNPKIATLVI